MIHEPYTLFEVDALNPKTAERGIIVVEAPDARVAGWAMIRRGLTVFSIKPMNVERMAIAPAPVEPLSPAELEAFRLVHRAARWLMWICIAMVLPPLIGLAALMAGIGRRDDVMAMICVSAVPAAYVLTFAVCGSEPRVRGIVLLLCGACPAAGVSLMLIAFGLAEPQAGAIPLIFGCIVFGLAAACITDTVRTALLLRQIRRRPGRGFTVEARAVGR